MAERLNPFGIIYFVTGSNNFRTEYSDQVKSERIQSRAIPLLTLRFKDRQ